MSERRAAPSRARLPGRTPRRGRSAGRQNAEREVGHGLAARGVLDAQQVVAGREEGGREAQHQVAGRIGKQTVAARRAQGEERQVDPGRVMGRRRRPLVL